MENHDHHPQHAPLNNPSRRYSAWTGAAIMVVVMVAFYVLREHWGHVLGYAPYLILLACPLMHIFMHGGHGHGHAHGGKNEAEGEVEDKDKRQ